MTASHIDARLRLALLLLAVICFVVFAGAGFGWWVTTRADGWLGAGAALFAASFI